jgi:hypothetical protein
MAREKQCSSVQAFFVLEGRRMIEEGMNPSPGEKIEAQLARVAIAYELPFDFVWRVYNRRCGWRAFLRLYQAYRTHKQGNEVAERLGELSERIDRLARAIEDRNRGIANGNRTHVHQPRLSRSCA